MAFLKRLLGRRAPGAGRLEIDELIGELGAARLEGYTADQRYADFRAVFLGSDAGRRVLWQILEWARIYRSIAVPSPGIGNIDPNMTHLREGERNIGLRILATLNQQFRKAGD